MDKKNLINKVGVKSTMGATNGHLTNNKAYDIHSIRKFKSDKTKKDELYDFCSPTFTDFTKQTSPAFPKLEYLGTGYISVIHGEPYTGADRKENLHFWRVQVVGFTPAAVE